MLTKYLNLNGCMFCGIMVLLLFIKEYYVSGACILASSSGPSARGGGAWGRGYMSYMFILRYNIYHDDMVYHFQAKTDSRPFVFNVACMCLRGTVLEKSLSSSSPSLSRRQSCWELTGENLARVGKKLIYAEPWRGAALHGRQVAGYTPRPLTLIHALI